MLIQQKLDNINSRNINNKTIDYVAFEWYETNKRIQIKKSVAGREVTLKFMSENPCLTEGDILFEEEDYIIVVDILPCECMVISPFNMFDTASVCYEIGNKHLPLFIENNDLLVPYEKPLFTMLTAQGYVVKLEQRKLLTPLRTSVSPHAHNGGESLFSRIMKLTS
jgi:urease accessory protein